MPHKHNAARRHHIGKMKFKVKNWTEYEAGHCKLNALKPTSGREALVHAA